MKRLIRISSLFFVAALIVIYACQTDDGQPTNLTGTWESFISASDGSFIVDFFLDQTDSVNVTGTFTNKSKIGDTGSLTGQVNGSLFTGTLFTSDCNMPFSFTIDTGQNTMSGSVSAVDSNCDGAPVVKMYREISPAVNITGSWTGSGSGTDGSFTFTAAFNQSGSSVTGLLISSDSGQVDSNSISGSVFGDVLIATITDAGGSACRHVFAGAVSNNVISGQFGFVNDNQGNGCDDNGTLTITKNLTKNREYAAGMKLSKAFSEDGRNRDAKRRNGIIPAHAVDMK